MTCILTTYPMEPNGYARRSYRNKKYLVHRLAYALANGLDPDKMIGVVMHSCDNRLCVNPKHLSLGTQQDNVLDMVRKGRGNPQKGEDRPLSKLTVEDVRLIRELYVERCRVNGGAALGRRFGVTQSVISTIVNNKAW